MSKVLISNRDLREDFFFLNKIVFESFKRFVPLEEIVVSSKFEIPQSFQV